MRHDGAGARWLAIALLLAAAGCEDDLGDRWTAPSLARADSGTAGADAGAADGPAGSAADARGAADTGSQPEAARAPDAAGATPDAAAPTTGGGAACDSCEARSCTGASGDYVIRCLRAPGRTSSGPRAGAARAELCSELVACMRQTGCAASSAQDCYCGSGVTLANCLAGRAAGACKPAVEAGAESTDPAQVLARFFDAGYATGNAFSLLERCDRPACASACGLAPGGPDCPGPDLDRNGVIDCRETLAANADFARDRTGWDPETNVTLAWEARDAESNPGSGALAVANATAADLAASTMAGGRRCLPAEAGAVYRLLAQVMIPAGQPAGTAGLAASYYPSGDCSGPALAAVNLPLAGKPDAWTVLTSDAQAPTGARSVLVRLVVVKPFMAAPVKALFDNVLVRRR